VPLPQCGALTVNEHGPTAEDVLRAAREAVANELPAEQMLLAVLRAAGRDPALLRQALHQASQERLDYGGH
jgi:hypothetical protein